VLQVHLELEALQMEKAAEVGDLMVQLQRTERQLAEAEARCRDLSEARNAPAPVAASPAKAFASPAKDSTAGSDVGSLLEMLEMLQQERAAEVRMCAGESSLAPAPGDPRVVGVLFLGQLGLIRVATCLTNCSLLAWVAMLTRLGGHLSRYSQLCSCRRMVLFWSTAALGNGGQRAPWSCLLVRRTLVVSGGPETGRNLLSCCIILSTSSKFWLQVGELTDSLERAREEKAAAEAHAMDLAWRLEMAEAKATDRAPAQQQGDQQGDQASWGLITRALQRSSCPSSRSSLKYIRCSWSCWAWTIGHVDLV
jgi:hypothetical protein